MDFKKIRQIEDLKEELSDLKQKNKELFKKNIEPKAVELTKEFIEELVEFFKEQDFKVNKTNDGITAKYKNHGFLIRRQENNISIEENGQQKWSIYASYNHFTHSGYGLPDGEADREIIRLQKEIEAAMRNTENYENPFVYLTIRADGRRFANPKDVIDQLFN
ncbi:hypothetical protein M3221_22250 [Domibacillus indicus]|uniref:hypothetical protein n=1 Tax=Domibacillus indicus TaxID=1437523 RepID=UPI00203F259B|nr:hypothetical protein [Domibacillus indicus]MCM3791065.1 hypothetical protein [Domibacillus indicus]